MADSRRKGKRGELEAAAEVARLFGVEAHRGRQYHGAPDARTCRWCCIAAIAGPGWPSSGWKTCLGWPCNCI